MRRDPSGIPSFLDGSQSIPEFESPVPLLFLSLLFVQGGGMDFSRVGEKLLTSMRSARNLGLLPAAPSERPEVSWQTCGQHTHEANSCPWLYSICKQPNCSCIRKLLTSNTSKNPGKKLLRCQFNSANGFQWLEDAISNA